MGKGILPGYQNFILLLKVITSDKVVKVCHIVQRLDHPESKFLENIIENKFIENKKEISKQHFLFFLHYILQNLMKMLESSPIG